MSPERCHRIETLYHAAMGLTGERRGAYLDRECDGDPDLRQGWSRCCGSTRTMRVHRLTSSLI
jgi:hypothetical protein